MTDSAADSIRNSIRRQTIATVAIALLLIAGGVLIYLDSAHQRSDLRSGQAEIRVTQRGLRDQQRDLKAAQGDLRKAQADLRRDELQLNRTLCAQSADLRAQIATTNEFLAKNPHGIPGISAATIRVNLERQKRFAATFAGLKCPPG